MHQDTAERIDAAAIEELKNPGTEPEWATSLDAARQRILEMEEESAIQEGMILIQAQVIADLDNEIARLETMNRIRQEVITQLGTERNRLLAEHDQLQARASRSIWAHIKDAARGRD